MSEIVKTTDERYIKLKKRSHEEISEAEVREALESAQSLVSYLKGLLPKEDGEQKSTDKPAETPATPAPAPSTPSPSPAPSEPTPPQPPVNAAPVPPVPPVQPAQPSSINLN